MVDANISTTRMTQIEWQTNRFMQAVMPKGMVE